jgi:dTDP-4-amino-4,6-dideoxygalactose transaminase
MVLDIEMLGVSRSRIAEALNAEGVAGLAQGYTNIHLLPMFQNKIAYGSSGFPWVSGVCKRDVNYQKGICPVAEKLHDQTFLGLAMCMYEMTDAEIDLIGQAFCKVWQQMDSLR